MKFLPNNEPAAYQRWKTKLLPQARTGPIATLQLHLQELRTAIPVVNQHATFAVCAKSVAIVSTLDVPIARNPRSPAAFLIRANGSTIRTSCKPSFNDLGSFDSPSKHLSRLIFDRVDNVDVLGKRMDKIEAAVLRCVDAIEQHISVTTTFSPAATSPSPSRARSSDRKIDSLALVQPRASEIDENESLIEDKEDWILAPEGEIRHLVTEGGGYEYFFGSSSLYSIWKEIMCSTETLFAQSQTFNTSRGPSENQDPQSLQISANSAVIAALDPELKSALHRACEHMQSFCAKPPLEECSDGIPLSLPPRFLLEAILDSFLRELNPTFPIFARSSLLAAIEVQYDIQRHQLDLAWATCFNNLILQVLTINAGDGAESFSRDESLRTTFLVNAQRCYRNLEALLKPRIVNVQAFLLMVSPIYY